MAFTERSEASRRAILTAARRLFAELGYEGTTIRGVASHVGIDPSMVMRYYQNKAGLFRAAIDLDLRLEDVPAPEPDRLGETLVRHFLSRWESEVPDEVLTLLMRSAPTTPAAAEQFRTIFASQIAGFVARVTGCGPDEASRRAGLVSTQLLGLTLTRYILRLPPVVAMDTEALARDVAPVLQYYLEGASGGVAANAGRAVQG